MKTGEQISDDHGQTWTVDVPLGRGVWSRTWALRGASGAVAVLKVPLRREDLADAPDAAALEAAASEVYEALAALYSSDEGQRPEEQPAGATPPPPPALAPRLGSVAAGQGFIFPRYASDLETRLQAGMSLGDVVGVLADLAARLARSRVHGNIRPTNILLDPDRGLALTDPRPTSAARAWQVLERALPGRVPYLPAEASGEPHAARDSGWDTWALCQILHRATLASPSSDDPRRGPVVESPRGGLSRVALATLKDAAAARLKTEDANRRFASRATEKLGSLLGRGLSAEHDPSPPYRFRSASELQQRLMEVADLIRPGVTSVSKPVLAQTAKDGVFDAGQPIEFAVNISTTAGVTGQDDIATGVQLRDLDGPEHARVRVPNARFSVKQYPSGRWRFMFTLPDVPPGRYQLRAAFLVKGGEADALVSEANFQVRPVAGYVPPPPTAAPVANAIPFGERAQAPRRAEASARPPAQDLTGSAGPVPIRPAASPTPDAAEDLPELRPSALESLEPRADGEVIHFPRRTSAPSPIRPTAYGEPDLEALPQPAARDAAWPRPPEAVAQPDPHDSPWRSPEPPTVASAGPPPHLHAAATPHLQPPQGTGYAPPPQAQPPQGPSWHHNAPLTPPRADDNATRPPADAGPAWSPWAPPARTDHAEPPRATATLPIQDLPPVSFEPAPPDGALDYPAPGEFPTGDLPIYDAPPAAAPPAWREAIARFVDMMGGDWLTAIAGVSASSLILVVIIAALAQRC